VVSSIFVVHGSHCPQTAFMFAILSYAQFKHRSNATVFLHVDIVL